MMYYNVLMDVLARNIRKYRKGLKLSASALSIKIGRGSNYIGRFERGETKSLGSDDIPKIAKVLNVTLDDPLSDKLLNQKPQMDASLIVDQVRELVNKYKPENIKSVSKVIEVPIVGVAPAGKPCILNESKGETVVIKLEQLEGSSTKGLFAITVSGESLSGDKIHDGYNLVFRSIQEIDIENKIYLCNVHGECTLKHCKWVDGKIRLYGTNSHYQDIEPDQCEIKGRCILISPPDIQV